MYSVSTASRLVFLSVLVESAGVMHKNTMYEPKKTENLHGKCFLYQLCKAQLCNELVLN